MKIKEIKFKRVRLHFPRDFEKPKIWFRTLSV
jgi:hypothetical protein